MNLLQNTIRKLQTEKQILQSRSFKNLPNLTDQQLLELMAVTSYDKVITTIRQVHHKKFIFHIAAPKSGSTWLTNSIGGYLKELGWSIPTLTVGGGNRSQDLHLTELCRLNIMDQNILTGHQHCVFSDYISGVLKDINAQLIIQVRNLFDMLISLRDHLDHQTTVKPMFILNQEHWHKLNDEAKLDFLIYNVAPWYINFWVGWVQAKNEFQERCKIIKYEDLLSTPAEMFLDILDFCGVEPSEIPQDITSIINKPGFTRKNKAIIGRGKIFTEEHKAHIRQLTKVYHDIDFSPLGIN